MKRILTILFVLVNSVIYSQATLTDLNLVFDISESNSYSSPFVVKGTVLHSTSEYNGNQINVGDLVYFQDGTTTYSLPITTIDSQSYSYVELQLIDISSTVSYVPTGRAALIRTSNPDLLPVPPDGIPSDLEAGILNDLRLKIQNGVTAAEEITDYAGGVIASPMVPPAVAASSYTGKTWRNSMGVLYRSDGVAWTPIGGAAFDTLYTDATNQVLVLQGPNDSLSTPIIDIAPVQSITAGTGISVVPYPGGVFNIVNTGDLSNTNEIELPSQTGNNGKALYTNGTSPYWGTVASSIDTFGVYGSNLLVSLLNDGQPAKSVTASSILSAANGVSGTSIVANQVAYGSGSNVITSSSDFKWNPATKTLEIIRNPDGTYQNYLLVGDNVSGVGGDIKLYIISNQKSGIRLSTQGQSMEAYSTTVGAFFGSTTAGSRTTVGSLLSNAGGPTYINFSTNGSATGLHITHNNGADLALMDNTGKLILGNGTPAAKLHVVGADNLSTGTALKVQGLTDNNALVVLNNGYVGFGTGSPSSEAHFKSDRLTGYNGQILYEVSKNSAQGVSVEYKRPDNTKQLLFGFSAGSSPDGGLGAMIGYTESLVMYAGYGTNIYSMVKVNASSGTLISNMSQVNTTAGAGLHVLWGTDYSTNALRVGNTSGSTWFNVRSDGLTTLGYYPNTLNSAGSPVNILSTSSTGVLESHTLAEVVSGGISASVGTGQVAYGTGTGIAGSNNLFWDNTNGRLGIGTTTPLAYVHSIMHPTATTPGIMSQRSGDNNFAPVIVFRKTRGSATSPTAVQAGDLLGSFDFQGMKTDNFTYSGDYAFFGAQVSGTPSGTTIPSSIFFKVGSSASPYNSAFYIHHSGRSRFGAVNMLAVLPQPNAKLEVIGEGNNSTTWTAQFHNNATNNALMIRDDGFVGIGTASPLAKIHIQGVDALSTSYSLLVQDNGSNKLLRLNNIGELEIGNYSTSGGKITPGQISSIASTTYTSGILRFALDRTHSTSGLAAIGMNSGFGLTDGTLFTTATTVAPSGTNTVSHTVLGISGLFSGTTTGDIYGTTTLLGNNGGLNVGPTGKQVNLRVSTQDSEANSGATWRGTAGASYTGILIDPVYNQQAGATGAVTGIDYNPVNTSVLGSHYGLLIRSGLSGFGTATPAQTVHVQGTARITGSDGTATTIMGRDADGDVSVLGLGSGLSITSGVLNVSASGATNLAVTGTASPLTLTSDTGTDVTFTAGTGVSLTGTSGNITINNTGDTNATDDLTTSTLFDGDIDGTYNGLAIKTNIISSDHIIDGNVTMAKIANAGATSGQIISWNGTTWTPSNIGYSGTGDVAGTAASLTVSKIQGRGVATTAPTSGQVLAWSGSLWAPTTLSTGITSLNGQTGTTQTFFASSTGTDFAISSSGNVHTFVLPTANATQTGKLTSSDWTTFNSKASIGGTPAADQLAVFTNGTTISSSSALSYSASTLTVAGDISPTGKLKAGTLGTTPTVIVGRNASNEISTVTVGAGLSFNTGTGTLTASNMYLADGSLAGYRTIGFGNNSIQFNSTGASTNGVEQLIYFTKTTGSNFQYPISIYDETATQKFVLKVASTAVTLRTNTEDLKLGTSTKEWSMTNAGLLQFPGLSSNPTSTANSMWFNTTTNRLMLKTNDGSVKTVATLQDDLAGTNTTWSVDFPIGGTSYGNLISGALSADLTVTLGGNLTEGREYTLHNSYNGGLYDVYWQIASGYTAYLKTYTGSLTSADAPIQTFNGDQFKIIRYGTVIYITN